MNLPLVSRTLGLLLLCLGGTMVFPLSVVLALGTEEVITFALSLGLTVAAGGILVAAGAPGEMGHREGFATVTFGWILFALFGALPFYLSGALPAFTDAYFEAMSGFTTTGATVLEDIEVHPAGLLLWRALTQWLGGMGIIVLSLAVLPALGVGGMQLYRAEVPGPTPDRLVPRIRETAKLLWGVYLLFSVSEVVLLRLGGMPLYDAVLHTFTTMATGGFSTKNQSVGAYQSPYLEGIVMLFMFLAGMNFALHFQVFAGQPGAILRNPEFRLYLGTLCGATAIATWSVFGGVYGEFWTALRHGAFQVVSIMTTTGYVTADYDRWPAAVQFLLFLLMFIGGCAGSTGGAIKHVRLLVLLKQVGHQLARLIHPKAVRHVHLREKVVPPEVLERVLSFVLIYLVLFALASFLLTLVDLDLVTAMGAVAASLGNVGPGLGLVGPAHTYAAVPIAGKWILSLCMLLGRLEIFTVLLLCLPDLWRGSRWPAGSPAAPESPAARPKPLTRATPPGTLDLRY